MASLAPSLRAIEPFARPGEPRLKLSLAAYSFREFFKTATHEQKTPPAERTLDMKSFIDFCANHACAGAELTSYYFPKEVSDAELLDVRRHAFLRGVAVSGTSVGNNFAQPKGAALEAEIASVKKWIERAAVLGAPHIRVFAGSSKGAALDEMEGNCISALEECCEYAGKYGIFLGLENHGGIVAEPAKLLKIVRAVKSPWFGVNLDTGNFHTADPYASLAECAPYAVNVQVKVEMQAAGAAKAEAADFGRIVRILRDANYQGWVALEYESAENPYTAVPRALDELRPLLDSPSEPAWKPLFDGKSLEGWKITEFAGHGDVTVENGQMILNMGSPLTGVTIAGEPPLRTDYEISVEAMKLSGNDFFCGLTFPVAQKSCTFIAGGWGGGLVGVSSLDGMDASENSTTKFAKFNPNQWYRFRIRVTADKIQAWIDDEQYVDVEITGRDVDMRAGEIELSAPLGLATFQTKSAIRDFKIRKL